MRKRTNRFSFLAAAVALMILPAGASNDPIGGGGGGGGGGGCVGGPYTSPWDCWHSGQYTNDATLSKTNETICVGGSVSPPTVSGGTFSPGIDLSYHFSYWPCVQDADEVYEREVTYTPSYYWDPPDFPASFTNCGTHYFHAYLRGFPPPGSLPCHVPTEPVYIGTFTVNVVQIISECAATTPTNRARTTIGVGEEVDLTTCGTPPGDITWTTSAGTLSSTNGTFTILTAPCSAGPVTVTVYFNGGSCDRQFSVIAPDRYISKTNRSDDSYGVNDAASGMYVDLWLSPTNVSFGAVWVMEVGAVSTNATGYFADTNVWPANYLDHGQYGANYPYHVSPNNWIFTDHAYSGVCSTPWSTGHFTWPVPAAWWIPGCSSNSLPWSDQDFTIAASGAVTVSKFGHIATRNTNNVYTTFQ